MELLNRLARLKFFTIVTDIRMHKTGTDIRVPGQTEAKESAQGGRRGQRAAAADAADESADGQPVMSDLPPSPRLMSGPDIDPALDVTIELDVYQFVKSEEAE